MLRTLGSGTLTLGSKSLPKSRTNLRTLGYLLRKSYNPTMALRASNGVVLARRSYAQMPGGGFPGFSMQPQRQKGDALKEYVSLYPLMYGHKLAHWILYIVERWPYGACEEWQTGPNYWQRWGFVISINLIGEFKLTQNSLAKKFEGQYRVSAQVKPLGGFLLTYFIVLSRRTKSNPVVSLIEHPPHWWFVIHAHFLQLIGPPGVGKTAILEGLASRIISKEVPEVRAQDSYWNFFYWPVRSLSKANVFSL